MHDAGLLSAALAHVAALDVFEPAQRVRWLEFRKGVELWPERQNYPALEAAYQAVADMPEVLGDEGARWEELHFQAERVVAG